LEFRVFRVFKVPLAIFKELKVFKVSKAFLEIVFKVLPENL
jgi:hypothetical protein